MDLTQWSAGSQLLVFGGLWFWLTVVVEIVIVLTCNYFQRRAYSGRIATISLLAVLAAMALLGGPNVFAIAFHYWYLTVPAIPLFFGGGWLNATKIQWKLFIKEEAARLEEEVRKFLRKQGIEGDSVPPHLNSEWQAHLSRVKPPIEMKPDPDNHKNDIYFWIGFWPVSLAWTMVSDPLTRIVKHIYHYSYESMKKASADAFAGVEKNLPPVPPTPPPGAPRNPDNPPDDSLPPSSYLHGKPEKERTHNRPAASGSGEFMISR